MDWRILSLGPGTNGGNGTVLETVRKKISILMIDD
jgi:hypothetical protein